MPISSYFYMPLKIGHEVRVSGKLVVLVQTLSLICAYHLGVSSSAMLLPVVVVSICKATPSLLAIVLGLTLCMIAD